MVSIFPSLISAHLLTLRQEIEQLEPYCDGFHIDIMDFHFVPNLTWGPLFVNAIRNGTYKQLWIHLMVEYPEKYLERFVLNKHDIISIHIESPSNLPLTELFKQIRLYNLIPSIAINPTTPLETLISLPVRLEHVLLMSVQPGFSRQQFLASSVDRIRTLNNFRIAHNLSFTIGIDGGITAHNSKELVLNGVNQLAVASAIFDYPDRQAALKKIQQA
jgi:ribulose-phosphate 3-epimerase